MYIVQVFIGEVKKNSGLQLIKNPWAKADTHDGTDGGHGESEAASSGGAGPSGILSVEEMSDPLFLARKRGFKEDALVADGDGSVYKITKLTVKTCEVELMDVDSAKKTIKTPLSTLVDKYKIFKGAVTSVLDIATTPLDNNPAFCQETAKGTIMYAIHLLHKKYQTWPSSQCLESLQNPFGVRATQKLPAQSLHLVPCTLNVKFVKKGEKAPAHELVLSSVNPGGLCFILGATTIIPKKDDNKAPFVNPFWLVAVDDSSANLELKWEEAGGVSIPTLVNSKIVPKGDYLARCLIGSNNNVVILHSTTPKTFFQQSAAAACATRAYTRTRSSWPVF